MPMQCILITDLHLRDPDHSPEAAKHAARIDAFLDRIAEMVPDAECCIVMGDLTDAGETAAYRWLYHRLSSLPFPAVPMLGNHDDRQAFRQVFGCSDGDEGFVQSTRQFGDRRLLFLDTHIPGADSGFLCEQRLDWLDGQLGEGGEVCLFLHHPPCDIGDPILDPIKLSNADDLAMLLRRHGNVRQIFFGHVHRTMFLRWNDIPCTSLDGLGTAGSQASWDQVPVIGVLTLDGEDLALTVRPLT
jgi:3',5'-cyclic AMP phosphodiesterase CpdA